MWSQFFWGRKLNNKYSFTVNVFYCRVVSLIPANRKPFFFRSERATNTKINTELNGYRRTYLEFC